MPSKHEPRPAIGLMRKLHMEPDPWQIEVLEENYQHLLLNCCRQAGKSTVVALLGLSHALFHHGSIVLLISRSFRQSSELFRLVKDFYFRLGEPYRERRTAAELQFKNHSRIVCLPCSEHTIRGYSGVSLILLDEAAVVPDDLYRAVRPMLAASGGRMICLSTPRGKRGFFYNAWVHGGADWKRIEVPASKISRLKPEHLEKDRRAMGESCFRQEYCCSFETLEGLVYPDLPGCVVAGPAPAFKRRYGGIDFGYRNPFAAIWGGLDQDGILWITNEHYVREQPPSWHATKIPRDVTWYADPHGAAERSEFRVAGFSVNKGIAEVRNGIAGVQTRIRKGSLKILEGACPNLLTEAGLYRWDDAPGNNRSEEPKEGYDHALDALRYLISRLDMGRQIAPAATADTPLTPKKSRFWELFDNPAVWTRIC
ncbi:MAG TPA: terminase family protein [Gemmataceae bacterium]|nr:terminase family protein [Gemmataceae bacterium]